MGDFFVFFAVVLYSGYEYVRKHMKGFLFYASILAVAIFVVMKGPHMGVFLTGSLAALAFGTLGGWILLAIAIIAVTALVENDHEVWAFFSLAATVAVLYHLRFSTLGFFVVHHPYQLAGWVLGYFALGAGYGVVKWTSIVHEALERYNEKKAEWLHGRTMTVPGAITTPEEALTFQKSLDSDLREPPQARQHKGDILVWMMYWPFSGLWWLINNPVVRIFRFIVARLSGVMQSISDRMFKNATADMKLAAEGARLQREAEEARRAAEDAKREADRLERQVQTGRGRELRRGNSDQL